MKGPKDHTFFSSRSFSLFSICNVNQWWSWYPAIISIFSPSHPHPHLLSLLSGLTLQCKGGKMSVNAFLKRILNKFQESTSTSGLIIVMNGYNCMCFFFFFIILFILSYSFFLLPLLLKSDYIHCTWEMQVKFN